MSNSEFENAFSELSEEEQDKVRPLT